MIQSMTGYGKRVIDYGGQKISVEIKSLNSKGIDLNLRLPNAYKSMEIEWRKRISDRLVRGKIDAGIYVEKTGAAPSAQVQTSVVTQYMEQLGALAPGAAPQELLAMALRLPDTLTQSQYEADDAELAQVQQLIEGALDDLVGFRSAEGQVLAEEFGMRIGIIRDLLHQVTAMDPERVQGVKTRLEKGLAALQTEVDQNRFEQELIYYIEKYDIAEEKLRLGNHLDYFEATMTQESDCGKKLGFITQEIGREINTTGSKANYAPMQQLVVQMKDELEKIKEQLLNAL